jgi:RimJ/RimL family protein N-acetyltransferase
MFTLETNRFLLRRIDQKDAQALFELDSDPEVMRYIGT